jgi:hypothetical protein
MTPAASSLAAQSPPPSFFRSALRLVAWQLVALVAAVALFAPVLLLNREFERRIDIPACHDTCESRGFRFESFLATKSEYSCTCASERGRQVFHQRAYLGGGHSGMSAGVDWLFRAGASLALGVGWPAALFLLFVRFKSRRTPRV